MEEENQYFSEIQIPNSNPASPGGTLAPQYSSQTDVNKMRLSSPASIPTSSITTPPPSAQQPSGTQVTTQPLVIARTPSPMLITMASPPPTERHPTTVTTVDLSALTIPSSQLSTTGMPDVPSPSKIDSAGADELRLMVEELSLSLREARTTAAHHNLQHNMLLIESSKEKNAMAVELAMVQRELEVLQEQLHEGEGARRNRMSMTPGGVRPSVEINVQVLQLEEVNSELRIRVQELRDENEHIKSLLSQSRRTSDVREGRITALEELNERLRQRIKENREHVNGLLDSGVFDRSPGSVLNTPGRAHYYTPGRTSQKENRRYNPTSTPHAAHERRDNFDALLLADKVLSQETVTAPSTPKSQRRMTQTHNTPQGHGHVRNTHSLSSLPSTPVRGRAIAGAPQSQSARTPVPLAAILDSQIPTSASGSRRRRRASSNSTISLDSDDELRTLAQQQPQQQQATAGYKRTPTKSARRKTTAASSSATFADHGVVEFVSVPESQASRAAGEMLRSFGSQASSLAGSPTKRVSAAASAAAAAAAAMKQSRIVGHITKSVLVPPLVTTHAAGSSTLPLVPAKQEHFYSGGLGVAGSGSPEKRRNVSGIPGAEVERAQGLVEAAAASGSPKKRRVDGGADRLDPLGISY